MDDGAVRVTIPRWGSRREARAFADREREWIQRQRRLIDEARSRTDQNLLPAAVERDLRERAQCELPPRLLELAAVHGLIVRHVSVRNQKARWGSCSRDGHICLNWRLLRMPREVRDYVMIHELMHLKRMDHSPKFWKLVARACPWYRDARAFLRNHPRV
jgi:predicted metal-dependent hydrolase